MWINIIQFILDSGERCQLCHDTGSGQALCDACAGELPRITAPCKRCGLPMSDPQASLCGECLSSPPAFDAAVIPLRYAPPVDNLIARLKYHGTLSMAPLLAGPLAQQAAGRDLDLPLPVPLHPQRLRERGYNQASGLCRQLSRHTGIPWYAGRLQRLEAGSAQRESRRRERLRSVRNAFRWTANGRCPERVAVVDDVVTTGPRRGPLRPA